MGADLGPDSWRLGGLAQLRDWEWGGLGQHGPDRPSVWRSAWLSSLSPSWSPDDQGLLHRGASVQGPDFCVQSTRWVPEGVVTMERGVGVSVGSPLCTRARMRVRTHAHMLTPFPSPAFTLTANHCDVAGWTNSTTLFERLVCATACLNHSHTQAHPTQLSAPQPHGAIPHTHSSSYSHPLSLPRTLSHSYVHKSQSQAHRKCNTPHSLSYSYPITDSHQHPFIPLPVAQSESQAIRTGIIHHTRCLTVSQTPHTYHKQAGTCGHTYMHTHYSVWQKRWEYPQRLGAGFLGLGFEEKKRQSQAPGLMEADVWPQP